ncbi:MAG TPA: hypothetical protein VFP55_04160 [Solirubrobacteraceae bacterium]|nr:hypothetical protein [Solirubrobacteraceae bacterium]
MNRRDQNDYDRLLGDIAEGARLHYGDRGADPDLALLQGDYLYARGLEQLADLGDLKAIGHLAEAISQVAQAQAAGDPGRAAAAWRAGVLKVRSRAGDDGAY